MISKRLTKMERIEEYCERQNIKANNLNRVFQIACREGHLDMVKFLLGYAEMNNLKIDIDANGNHAFIFACGNGHLEMVKFLLSLSTNELVENASFGKVEENDSSFKNAKMNNREIDIHAEEDFAFRCCRNEKIIDLLLPLLNRNKDEFYFYKEEEYYILKPLDFEMDLSRTKFEYFQIYHEETDYIDDCIEAYHSYLKRFRKKSALSFIYDE